MELPNYEKKYVDNRIGEIDKYLLHFDGSKIMNGDLKMGNNQIIIIEDGDNQFNVVKKKQLDN